MPYKVRTTAQQGDRDEGDAMTTTPAGETTGTVTMKAIVQGRYGGSETFEVTRLTRPEPGPGELLVRCAAAIDRGTWHLMTGLPLIARPAIGLRKPKTPVPGRDTAGTIAAVGPGVTGFAVGDEVIGTAAGSLAEYALIPWPGSPMHHRRQRPSRPPPCRSRSDRTAGGACRAHHRGRPGADHRCLGRGRVVCGADRRIGRCAGHRGRIRCQGGLRPFARRDRIHRLHRRPDRPHPDLA